MPDEDRRKSPRLTRAQEFELWRRMQDGDDDARATLVTAHLGLVRRLALQYLGNVPQGARGVVDLDDLIGEGELGLMVAINRWRPDRPDAAPLVNYVAREVKKRLYETVTCTTSLTEVPKHAGDDLVAAKQLRRSLTVDGAEPTGAVLEAALVLRGKTTTRAQVAVERLTREAGPVSDVLSLEKITGSRGGEDATLGDVLIDPEYREPVQTETPREALAARCWATLTAEEQRVLHLHLGLGGDDALPMTKVAERTGLSVASVQRIRDSGMAKMRAAAGVAEE